MSRLGIRPLSTAPDVRRYVGSCMTCHHHWQIDVRPGSVSDLGGGQPALMAMAEAHAEHLKDCPGAGGRVNINGRWVDPPLMSEGQPSDGTMQMDALPRWWVTR